MTRRIISAIGIIAAFAGVLPLVLGYLAARSADGQGATAAGLVGVVAVAIGAALLIAAGLAWIPFYFAGGHR